MTKHFGKNLQEICDILEELNEELLESIGMDENSNWFTGLTCEFNEWWACIKFEDMIVLDTENDEREYLGEDIDDYEDLKDCIQRVLLEKFARYSLYKFKA